MSKAPFDPCQLIDLESFPIHDLDSSLGCDFLRDCQAELDATGACNLTGFVKDRAVDEMVAEALELVPLAYRKDTRRNAFFTQDDPALPPDHPLRRYFPLRMAQLANDVIPKNAAIQQLYEWNPLTEFIRRVLGLEALYRTADPFLALNLTYLQAGDLQPWHYDHNEFTVTLLLQEPESGGEFEYVPKLRTDDDENFEAVGRLFAGTYGDIHTLPRRPGTLTIFKGRHAMHRVTEVHGDRLRISALFSYDGLPNQRADDTTNAFIYGPRVAAILTGGR
jgi:hypothetical protein